MKLDDIAVYNIIKVLKVAREEEAKKQIIDPKRLYNRPRKRSIEELEKENEKEILEISSSDLNIEITEIVTRRTRARKAE